MAHQLQELEVVAEIQLMVVMAEQVVVETEELQEPLIQVAEVVAEVIQRQLPLEQEEVV
tara:strand:+ start:478 stop:654 length:177 start_codon:yes stop_codon:yes gene_type:complete